MSYYVIKYEFMGQDSEDPGVVRSVSDNQTVVVAGPRSARIVCACIWLQTPGQPNPPGRQIPYYFPVLSDRGDSG